MLTPRIKRSNSKTWMDALLGKFECDDASVGFRVANPYRIAAARHRELSYGGAPSHNPAMRELQQRAPLQQDPSGKFDAWRCAGTGCRNADFASLVLDDDGSNLVCPSCGTTVRGSSNMIQLHRQKNCAEEDDRTITADAPTRRYETDAADGRFETAIEAKKRKIFELASTTCGRSRSAPSLSSAQTRVTNGALREIREVDPIDDAAEKKLRSIGTTMQLAFDKHLTSLTPQIETHIRKTAKCIVKKGTEHAKICGSKCQVALLSRPNALIATSTIKACLERLVCPHPETPAEERLSAVAPETPLPTVEAALDKAKSITISNTGLAQRTQTTATIDLILGWSAHDMSKPCPGCEPVEVAIFESGNQGSVIPSSLPGMHGFSLPPPLVSVASSSSLSSQELGIQPSSSPPATPVAAGAVWALRDAIYAAGKISTACPEVHSVALGSIQDPAISSWIANENHLPIDVLGVVVLRSAMLKLKREDSTSHVMTSTCARYSISPTSANDASVLIASLMPTYLVSCPSDSLF